MRYFSTFDLTIKAPAIKPIRKVSVRNSQREDCSHPSFKTPCEQEIQTRSINEQPYAVIKFCRFYAKKRHFPVSINQQSDKADNNFYNQHLRDKIAAGESDKADNNFYNPPPYFRPERCKHDQQRRKLRL